MRILLVEDDAELAREIATGMREAGWRVTHASTYDDWLRAATLEEHDVIILDVMLPGGSGFELCRALRREERSTPILMLTARDAVDDRVTGLDAGADDYLTKPFALQELQARVRALARRRPALTPRTVTVADLEIDLAGRRARRAGRAIELTAKEFALLDYFVRHAGEVASRTLIAEHVWDMNFDSDTNVVDVAVRRLRAKLDDRFETKLIHTIRGVGYVFDSRP